MTPDYEHWFEVVLGALIALGAWLFRLGRKYQEQQGALKSLAETCARLEADLAEEVRKRGEHNDEIFARLRAIERSQAEHGARIEAVASCCERIDRNVNQYLLCIRPGGMRASDPPA